VSEALLDGETLGQLRVLEVRRPGFLARVVLRYLDELDGRLATLRTALDMGELEMLTELVHSLKGDSRLIGAEPAAREAERLERAARAGSLAECGPALDALVAVLEPTRALLRDLPECVEARGYAGERK
jgi:HPt (histidine-containing phosphotransfer) domain-containing protein